MDERSPFERLYVRSAAPASPAGMPPTPSQVDPDLMTRALTVRAGSADENARTVEATIATEQPVTVFDFRRFEPIDEVLRMDGVELPDQVPMLSDHFRFSIEAVLGSIRSLRVEGSKLLGRLHFASGDDRAERAWQKVKQGHITDLSAGYRSIEFVDIAPKSTQVIKGRQYTAGERTLRITTRWAIKEGSLVPIGADPATKVREHAQGPTPGTPGTSGTPGAPPNTKVSGMNPQLRAYLESLGLRKDADEAAAWAFLASRNADEKRHAYELIQGRGEPAPAAGGAGSGNGSTTPQEGQRAAAQTPAAPAPPASPAAASASAGAPGAPDVNAIRAETIRLERERVTQLRDLAGSDIPAELVNRAISEGWDTGRASAEFLRHFRGGHGAPLAAGPGGAPAGVVRDHERDATRDALAFGLLHRCSVRLFDPRASEAQRRQAEQLADQGYRYRHLTLLDLCRESLRLEGRQAPWDRDEMIRAAVSTGSLSHIFTSSVNARLMQSYDEAPDTTDWVSEEDVPDFKDNERIALGKTGELEKLPRGGTAKHATRSSSQEKYKVYRYAKQFVVDEQDIIDDRLGALMEMPAEMGTAARRLRPDMVYALLIRNPALAADSKAVFHTDHANTASDAFDAAKLKVGIAKMMLQQEDGVNLNLVPVYLITVPTLKWTASELISSAEIRDTTASKERGTRNVLQDENLQLRVDSRLENGVTDPITGVAQTGAATKWFLAARNALNRTIRVAYLAGTGRRPMVRSFTLNQGQWGIGWDVKLDIGAAPMDYRGLYRGNS